MRSLDSAREAWQELQKYQSLHELKVAIRLDGTHSIATAGCRSSCWKIFLLFDTLDPSMWQRTLASARSAYDSLRSHFLSYLENPDALGSGQDPLSEDTESSVWTQFRKDEELRGEILQDVVRCMPENPYFRQPDTQRMLLDILFIFCKLNPDLSYRQGMHEILAPILWVVERDAVDLGQSSKALGEDAVINATFNAEYIEHDAFALFGQVMQSAKNFYEQTTMSGKENPMVSRSRRIFNDFLPLVDKRLAKHLESIDIVPQIFLMRWIRLLFGREFAFDEVLTMWDVIFAEDVTLEIVDHICLVMLLRIRWDLIVAEYNVALTLLLKYPEPEKGFQPQSLVLDALYLRQHMDQHSGSHLVSKHTGRPIKQAGRPLTPPALQRNITTFSKPVTRGAASKATSSPPSHSPRPTRNFETLVQSTAKNIYSQGEKLGIGKAVRSAVDEVHRKAQEIRDIQTPTPPATRRYGGSSSAWGSDSLQSQVKRLEDRSKQLAKLLEGAVAELWECQKLTADGSEDTQLTADTKSIEKLTTAVAKVQFVQVYLDDLSLPLPQDPDTQPNDQEDDNALGNKVALQGHMHDRSSRGELPSAKNLALGEDPPLPAPKPLSKSEVQSLADPSTFESDLETSNEPETQVPEIVLQEETDTVTPEAASATPSFRTNSSLSRPRLEQSSFSWMLEKEDTPNRPLGNKSVDQEHGRAKSSLFGEGAGDRSAPSTGRPGSKDPGIISSNVDVNNDTKAFDMGSLRHGRSKQL